MNKLLFIILFFFSFNLFAQIPETEDSIYWSGTYCDTAETIEEALNQWIWSSDVNDCVQPNLKDIENLWIALWLSDTYECCCEIASLPGSNAAMTGFWESNCQDYLDNINFNYMSIDDNYINKLDVIYIDLYGRQHITPPKGLSIMNRKTYFRL
tara:strand:+ start:41 stop:502 length:462 start_codon:yes stop_codon:yes gene_type:complete